MSITPPPPPPPPPRKSSIITTSQTSSGSQKNKLNHQHSTPPVSSISDHTTITTTSDDDDHPFPSDSSDSARSREILVDITEETNNRLITLRRTLTTSLSPSPSPDPIPSIRRPHTGPVTRSRSMISLPTPPLTQSRSQTPLINSHRRSQRPEGVDENDSSPATSRSVSTQLTLTPSHHSLHHPLYTPSPLGHRTFEDHQQEQPPPHHPSLPPLRLRPSLSLPRTEPILTRRRRRRSEDETGRDQTHESRSIEMNSNRIESSSMRSTRILRRLREGSSSVRNGELSHPSITSSDQDSFNSTSRTHAIENHREEKRRKRNPSRLIGLGRL
ncbi:hypothetical protein DFH28DRAFT_964212 [Melampsora americana]|nr:hypothetical protein DFH28DRAFT_964212 [Melampsora americana]